MLLELAVGDAYGAGFEYANENVTAYNNLSRYIKHPRHAIIPGCYTDDTQMSIAITEAIVSNVEWSHANLAEQFVTAFKRDPREGYSGQFYEFLLSVTSGADFLARINPESDKSGAAMRSVPLGILPTIPEVIQKTTLQAQLTHNTPDGITAAVAVALSAHYMMYGLGSKADLGDFLETHLHSSHRWSQPYEGKVKAKGWMSVRAALTALNQSTSMSQLLQTCIAFTGDVDTVAAIALGIASFCPEIDPDLPEQLIASLENGPFGRAYLIALDAQFKALLTSYRMKMDVAPYST